MEQNKNIKVDAFLNETKTWEKEYRYLREIILETPLEEEFKWMHPCYTLNGKNVVLIHAFKDYIALLFHKGALLTDPEQQLIQQTKNVQAARQLRFKDLEEIKEKRELISDYVNEAIAVEKSGKQVAKKPHEAYEQPEELIAKFEQMPELEIAFNQLTPGRQRAYILNISQAKRSETRTARVEKYIDLIMAGKGLNDK